MHSTAMMMMMSLRFCEQKITEITMKVPHETFNEKDMRKESKT
jgi:hypothetical protein